MRTVAWIYPVLTLTVLTAAPVATAGSLDPDLERVAAHGKDLFTHAKFNGNGNVCETCHLGGGLKPGRRPDGVALPSLGNAAAIYPRYNPRAEKIFTLQDQIKSCIANAVEGSPPDDGGETVSALTVYVTSLAQGKPLDMGGKPR